MAEITTQIPPDHLISPTEGQLLKCLPDPYDKHAWAEWLWTCQRAERQVLKLQPQRPEKGGR